MKGEFRLERYIVPIQKLHNSEMAIIFSLTQLFIRISSSTPESPISLRILVGKLMYYLLCNEVVNGPPASCRLKTRQWRNVTLLMPGFVG